MAGGGATGSEIRVDIGSAGGNEVGAGDGADASADPSGTARKRRRTSAPVRNQPICYLSSISCTR
jgi:hypothetical protein